MQSGPCTCLQTQHVFHVTHKLFSIQIPVERCSVYDPVFSPTERETLTALGFTVLTENEVNTHKCMKTAGDTRFIVKLI